VHDVVEIAPQGLPSADCFMGEFAVAEDRSEDVVEVVRDTARQGADRLHFLRLSQLRL
jgi:hypothetical protein